MKLSEIIRYFGEYDFNEKTNKKEYILDLYGFKFYNDEHIKILIPFGDCYILEDSLVIKAKNFDLDNERNWNSEIKFDLSIAQAIINFYVDNYQDKLEFLKNNDTDIINNKKIDCSKIKDLFDKEDYCDFIKEIVYQTIKVPDTGKVINSASFIYNFINKKGEKHEFKNKHQIEYNFKDYFNNRNEYDRNFYNEVIKLINSICS